MGKKHNLDVIQKFRFVPDIGDNLSLPEAEQLSWMLNDIHPKKQADLRLRGSKLDTAAKVTEELDAHIAGGISDIRNACCFDADGKEVAITDPQVLLEKLKSVVQQQVYTRLLYGVGDRELKKLVERSSGA